MIISQVSLHRCPGCHVEFNKNDNPIPHSLYVTVTCCFHVYHPRCLKDWLQKNESCPNCRQPCYQYPAGKDGSVIWKIFINALQTNPSTIIDVLQSATHEQEECAICCETLPSTPLQFDVQEKRLIHQGCLPSPGKSSLTLNVISQVVRKSAEVNAEIARLLTPPPPPSK